MKKLAKTSLRVFLTRGGNDILAISLHDGGKSHQFRHGVMGSWPVTVGIPTLAGMIVLDLIGISG